MDKTNGKYVYRNIAAMKRVHVFYDKSLAGLQVKYTEERVHTIYGDTHILFIGDENKPTIFTLHGGNGITTLNIKLFLPLLKNYYIIAPDVIGMPGKSEPHRNLNINTDDFGIWISQVMDELKLVSSLFVVSSYSAGMLLSLAKIAPHRIEKAALLAPSGIAHGALLPIISKMVIPFMRYYFKPLQRNLENIVGIMVSDYDNLWYEFFDLMMSSYNMEMRPPREYSERALKGFRSPIILFASNDDIFFPADKVISKAKEIFHGSLQTHIIPGKHLPSNKTMELICEQITEFFEDANMPS